MFTASIRPVNILSALARTRFLLSYTRTIQRTQGFTQFSTMAPEGWIQVPSNGSIPPYAAFIKPIQKSPQDDRDYRIIRLENGLSATIVHDPTADKAAASLDVAVGHLYDPVGSARSMLSVVF